MNADDDTKPMFVLVTYTKGLLERNEPLTVTRQFFEPIEDEL